MFAEVLTGTIYIYTFHISYFSVPSDNVADRSRVAGSGEIHIFTWYSWFSCNKKWEMVGKLNTTSEHGVSAVIMSKHNNIDMSGAERRAVEKER